jgi:RNA polymerase sigma-70 factor (ECF subfamily)
VSDRRVPSLDLLATVELARRASAGEPAALEALVTRVRPRLMRWARGLIPRGARSLAETEDIVQEALISTLRNLSGLERPEAFVPYLRQAVRHRIFDLARRGARFPETDLPANFEPADPEARPDERLAAAELTERYEVALATLPERDRLAVILRMEWSLPYRDLAIELGLPSADAARMTTTRAVAALARAVAA